MHIAAGDCERIRPGPIAQPVNTASSLAYVVAGGWIWWRADRRSRTASRWLAASAVAAGVGSVAYHGPGGAAGKLVHDAGAATLAGAAVVTGLRHRPRGRPVLAAAAAGTAVVAAAVHATSRTGGPLCCPESAVQGHAAWHLLGSLAAVLLAESIREPRRTPPERDPGIAVARSLDDGTVTAAPTAAGSPLSAAGSPLRSRPGDEGHDEGGGPGPDPHRPAPLPGW